MRKTTKFILLILCQFSLALTACGNMNPQTDLAKPTPFQPVVKITKPSAAPTLLPEKEQTMATFTPIRGEGIMIQTASLKQNAQGRWELRISGQIPTPCHQINLQTTVQEAKIFFEVSSSPKANVMCAQVITDFEQVIPIPDVPVGSYQIFINGVLLGVIQV
jgi:hypothetical protein